jgi:hypothetical protein
MRFHTISKRKQMPTLGVAPADTTDAIALGGRF